MRRKAVAGNPSRLHHVRPPAARHDQPCPRPFSEPLESYEDANDALDQIDRCVERVLLAGGEFALRRRLAQVLGPGTLV